MDQDQRTAVVDVWAGDDGAYLGRGKLAGFVTTWHVKLPSGNITSVANPELPPTKEDIDEIIEAEGTIVLSNDMPKIVLDSGQVVYGCQVFWSRADV